MSCRGVFFAIDEKTVQTLKNEKRVNIVDFVQEEIEEIYFDEFENQVAEIDKAWDATQRAFSESELEFKPTKGIYPANMIVLGGEVLYGDGEEEDDYIITLKNPLEVKEIYRFLSEFSEDEFKTLYFKIDRDQYGLDVDEQDCAYTWEWLSGTIDFWKNASEKNLSVIFTVDQ